MSGYPSIGMIFLSQKNENREREFFAGERGHPRLSLPAALACSPVKDIVGSKPVPALMLTNIETASINKRQRLTNDYLGYRTMLATFKQHEATRAQESAGITCVETDT
jgi:hypothetical protein